MRLGDIDTITNLLDMVLVLVMQAKIDIINIADDFLQKPFSCDQIEFVLERLGRRVRLERENAVDLELYGIARRRLLL